MNLFLLRHGDAEATAVSDTERPLTERGFREVASVAREFVSRNLEVDACYVSPALRAKQTADTFLGFFFEAPECIVTEALNPDRRAAQLMRLLGDVQAENVLLVSHNPILSELLALLTEGSIDHMHILDTSELACVRLDIIGLGMGSCPFILSPGTSHVPAS